MTSRKLLILFLLLLVCLILSVLPLFGIVDEQLAPLLAMPVFMVAAVFAVYLLESPANRSDLFHPCYILVGATVFHFLGPSFYNYRQDFYPTMSLGPYIVAHYVVIGGLLFIILGFFLCPAPPRSQALEIRGLRSPRARLIANTGIVALLCLSLGSSFFLVFSEGGLANYMSRLGSRLELFEGQGVLLSLTLVSISATILSYIQVRLNPSALVPKFLLAVSAATAFLTTILSGSRANLIVLILMLLIIRHRVVRRIRPLAGGMVVLVLLSVGFGYIALVRQSTVQSDLADSEGPRGKVSFVYNTLFGKGTFIELNSIARVLEGVPSELPYQYGMTYLSVFTFPIPRTLFPSKVNGTSEVYTRALRPEIWAAGRGDRVTFFGETIVNFGIPGAIFGSLLLGALARQIYARCNRQLGDPYASALYAFFILWLMIVFRGDTAFATWEVLRVCLPVLVIHMIVHRFVVRRSRSNVLLASQRGIS